MNVSASQPVSRYSSISQEIQNKITKTSSLDSKKENEETDSVDEYEEKEIDEIIKHIIDVRDTARSVLMWSYPYAYMLPEGSSELKIFEFVQKELEVSFEKMLFYFQVERVNITFSNLINMVNSANISTETLLKHVDIYFKK